MGIILEGDPEASPSDLVIAQKKRERERERDGEYKESTVDTRNVEKSSPTYLKF